MGAGAASRGHAARRRSPESREPGRRRARDLPTAGRPAGRDGVSRAWRDRLRPDYAQIKTEPRRSVRRRHAASQRRNRKGRDMRHHRLVPAMSLAAIAAILISATALAGTRVEDAFYNGQTVQFIQPAVFSADPNGGTFACFGLGPDLTGTNRSAVTPTLYVILNDFATQDHCDGDATALRHDHVLSTVPGQAD